MKNFGETSYRKSFFIIILDSRYLIGLLEFYNCWYLVLVQGVINKVVKGKILVSKILIIGRSKSIRRYLHLFGLMFRTYWSWWGSFRRSLECVRAISCSSYMMWYLCPTVISRSKDAEKNRSKGGGQHNCLGWGTQCRTCIWASGIFRYWTICIYPA